MNEAEKVGLDQGLIYEEISKREYFAAMAMQGLVSTLSVQRAELSRFVAETSVEYADALIEELKKSGVEK